MEEYRCSKCARKLILGGTVRCEEKGKCPNKNHESAVKDKEKYKNKDENMEDDMKLPKDEKAENCIHFKKCSRMYGCKAENTTCDFAPSRFMPNKIEKIKNLIIHYGHVAGDHHKAWMIDQIMRIIEGDKYEEFVKNFEYSDMSRTITDEKHYTWDEGKAPL